MSKPSSRRKLNLQELGRVDSKAFKQQSKTPIVLVLEDIRSGMNVGSAFRTADAFALEHIYLCGITAQPPHREILKTAIGATESMEWSYHSQSLDLVEELIKKGYHIVSVEQTEGSTLLQDFRPPEGQKLALVFGNEVNGVSQTVIDSSNQSLEVPQFGVKHSLNISVCLGIVVWDCFQKLKLK